jgi:hypothetical protein
VRHFMYSRALRSPLRYPCASNREFGFVPEHVRTLADSDRGLFISGDTYNSEQRVFGHREPKTQLINRVSPPGPPLF